MPTPVTLTAHATTAGSTVKKAVSKKFTVLSGGLGTTGGHIVKAITKNFSQSSTLVLSLRKRVNKAALTASLSKAAVLTRTYHKNLIQSLTTTVSKKRQIGKRILGTSTIVPQSLKKFFRTLSATLSKTARMTQVFVLSYILSLIRQFVRPAESRTTQRSN